MRRKPLRLAAYPLIAWLCLAAHPVLADAAFTDFSEPESAQPGFAATAFKSREPKGSFEQPEYKSRGIAFLWSMAGIAAPVSLAAYISNSTHGGSEAWVGGLAAGGMLLGPSLGQVYAGSHKGAWLGAGIRTVGALSASQGMALLSEDLFCSTEDGDDCDLNIMAVSLFTVGIYAYVVGTVYSFINADMTVERYNETQSRLGVIDWSPILAPDFQGGIRAGALAYLRF